MSFRSREVITIIKVACIQSKAGNIREYKDSWARVLQLVDRAVSEEVDLVVLPIFSVMTRRKRTGQWQEAPR